MSAKRDRIHNELVIPFYHDQQLTSGATVNSTAYDTMIGRSNPTNMLLILMMKTWEADGAIVVRVQDCMTETGTFVTFKNFARATAASGNTTFVGQADRFRRWIRLRIDCIGGSVSLTAIGVLARGRREPITNYTGVGTLSDGSSESSSSSQSSSSSSESSSSSQSSSSSG